MKAIKQNITGITFKEYIAFIFLLISIICGVFVYHSYAQNNDEHFIASGELITSLDLSNRGLTEIPPEVFGMTNLERLDLSNNYISSISPDIRKLYNLKVLVVGSNNFTEFPEELNRLVQLREIHLPYEQWWYKINALRKITKAQIVLY